MQTVVTLKDVARIAGVSARTVSLAISGGGRMTAGTRERILRIARDMNYQPDLAAKGVRLRKSFLIGAVFPYLNISFFNRIIGGIEERCFKAGYDILIASPPPDGTMAALHEGPDKARTIDRLIARRVEGIIAAPSPTAHVPYQRIVDAGIPFLQVLTRIPGLSAPFIGVENIKGGWMATTHLIELGHTSIGFLKSSVNHYVEMEQRYEGYLEALVEHGIKVDTRRMCVEAGSLGDINAAQESTKLLLDQVPDMTAIFAPTDYAALGAVKACMDRGLNVPRDFSVIGYDDIEIASQQIEHPLSTIAQPKEEIGRQAFEMLLSLITGKTVTDQLVSPTLVIRATTACAPSHRTLR